MNDRARIAGEFAENVPFISIDCGPGNDHVVVESSIDVPTWDCEKVRNR